MLYHETLDVAGNRTSNSQRNSYGEAGSRAPRPISWGGKCQKTLAGMRSLRIVRGRVGRSHMGGTDGTGRQD